MSSNTSCRVANQSDAEDIAQFQIIMALETEDYKLDLHTVTAGVTHLINHPELGHYRVIQNGDDIIGCFLVLKEWSDWRNSTVLWIHSLFIIKEFRNKGVFKDAYEQLKAEVQSSEKLSGIRLYVEKENHQAQKVYQAIGMSKEHYDMYEWLK